MPYDDVYAIATPGRVFDMFTNQAHALRAGPRRPGGSLMLFAGAQAAAALMRESDEVIVERFLADLHAMYPQTRGVIAGATVRRWELGNVYASPGRGRAPARAGGRARRPREPAPGRRLLRRAGDDGGRRPDRARGRRTSRVHESERSPMSELPRRPARADHAVHRGRRARSTPTRWRAFVERLIGAGVGGLVPGGSTGEFTTLTNAERRLLIEVTVEAAAGRVPVVAGTGALSTRETVELSVHAEQAGAAAVMIIPPFYDAPVLARAAGPLRRRSRTRSRSRSCTTTCPASRA